MTTSTTLNATILGTSDTSSWDVDIVQLPNGDLFALNYNQNSSTNVTSKVEFLAPSATSIANVTSSAAIGSLPANIGSTPLIAELYVGSNSLPDIVLGDGGLDQPPWLGGQVKVLAPNANGQYVDETSALPQIMAYNHRLSTGTIDGQAAIVVAQIGNESNLPVGVELILANSNGTFTNWTSHIPSSVENSSVYTYDVIGNFAGQGGDIFLGSIDATRQSDVLLVNDGSGDFTAKTLNISVPQLFKTGELDTNGFAAQMTVVYALPTKFAGDVDQDMIVVYANSAAASYGGKDATEQAYYLQFLQGDGKGDFSDVTAQHLASQPTLLNASGQNAWIISVQQVSINGFNDLVLYEESGPAEILVNDGHDHYSPSSEALPTNLFAATWGTDNGVQGFFGQNSSNQWVFVPVSQVAATQSSDTIDAPLAAQIYLYGANSTGAANVGQSFETPVTITLHGLYNASAAASAESFSVVVNGQTIGSSVLAQNYGFTYQGAQYTTDQTFTFEVAGLGNIGSIQVDTVPNSGLYLQDVKVGSVDLGSNINSWVPSQNVISLDPANWNSVYNANLGTAADPFKVVGGGGNSTVYVLGNHTQYAESGIGTSTVTLSESASLGQNAVLTDVSYIAFQDGSVLNTATGALTYSLSQSGQTVSIGDYGIANNQWGVPYNAGASPPSYVAISYGQQGGTGGVAFTQAFPAYQPTAGVWGFSEVYWGGTYNSVDPSLNTSVANLKSLIVTYATILTGTTDQRSDELLQFYVKDAAGKVVNDISVQTAGWDPISGTITWQPGWTNKAYSDSHITANLLMGTANDADGVVPMDVFRTTTDQLGGTVDVGQLLQYLVKAGLVNASDYISGVELGTETISGASAFSVNSFNVFETVSSASTIMDTGSQANQIFDITTNNNYLIDGTSQYAAGDIVRINSSAFGFTFTTSTDGHLHLAETGFGAIGITNADTIQFSDGTLAVGPGKSLTLSTASANLAANLSALEAADTSSADHITVTLTDAASIPTIKLTAAQFNADTAALQAISGTFNTEIVAPSTSVTINGSVSGLGTTVDFANNAASYTIVANPDHSITVTEGSAVYHLTNVTELNFADTQDIVASQTAAAGGGVSSAQITNLYAAVFNRLPDVGGLAYYEQTAAANPGINITSYAEWFLSSPEYTGNSAHNYAQSEIGEAQFITDTYANLLHRAPEAGAVSWYEANVIDPLLKGLVAGTAAYAQADLYAHALVLTDFSGSAEFVGDVQITAQQASNSAHWLLLV